MIFDRVNAQPDHLCATLCKLAFQSGYRAKLCRTNRSKVLRVREENRPVVADPFVEADRAVSGLCCEIRSNIIDTE